MIKRTLNIIPLLICFSISVITGCEYFNPTQVKQYSNRPDLDCIVANDFYAMHFSVYVQPKNADSAKDKNTFVPYCQEIPIEGQMFFSADLIDRDIRETPIKVRLVEVEYKNENGSESINEIRVLKEVEQKLYTKGIVEAQADIDKKGSYILYLLIGEGIEEDDRFKIKLTVGDNSKQYLIISIGAAVLVALVLIGWLIRMIYLKKKAS
ncbi:hypothetical protein [Methylocucumis oryzae]|uniref:Lipoprotein n=1 Tax=Methylocucumis oryzae TaxID=1632867 RepID=A0A0F3IFS6_9GAMM|nr:hypothetical protein [Methylocucumis oryzae]KJV05403.1 hypothetical protein VZ94_18455 [Methylocucumis oryzae]